MRTLLLVPGLFLVLPMMMGAKLPDRLANVANQPDVVLMPPVGEPSPKAGSFLVPYEPPEGEEPDPKKEGTYGVAPSSCSEALEFKTVSAAESREELWMVETGIGATIGMPFLDLGGGYGRKSIAGIEYELADKLIVDGGLAELEMCCLQTPEKCTGDYVSEVWRGTGNLHRIVGNNASIRATVKQLEKAGSISFENAKGWSMASSWDEPMYFAYRVQQFQRPECESYMNNLPEVEGKVLFTGVSERKESERTARTGARTDARQQVVEYLGTSFVVDDGEVHELAEGLVSGVKDSLICLDPVLDTPDGPRYLARVRMYVDAEKLGAATAEMESRTE